MKVFSRIVTVLFPVLILASATDAKETSKMEPGLAADESESVFKIDPAAIQKMRLQKQQATQFGTKPDYGKRYVLHSGAHLRKSSPSWLPSKTPSFLKKRNSSITPLPSRSSQDVIQILFNGSTDTSYTIGDTLTITVIFSTGEDSALIGGYLDDGDSTLDPNSDYWLFEDEGDMWIFDNDDEDENDSLGIWEVTFTTGEDGEDEDTMPFSLEGALLFFTATDGGGTATAQVAIEGIDSEFSISGAVNPAMTGIIVIAIPSWAIEFEEDTEPTEIWAAVTDSGGSYAIHVEEPGLYYVIASDFLGVTDPQLFPEEFWQWVDTWGHVTDVNFNLVEANAWIAGYVEDQDGNPVGDVTVWAENGPYESDATTDAGGYYYLGVMAWEDPFGGDWWETKWKLNLDENDLWPDFMIPHGRGIVVHPGELVDDPERTHYTLYINDATISGTITLPSDIQVDCFGIHVHHSEFEVFNWIDFCDDDFTSPLEYSIPVASYLDDYGEYWIGMWIDEPEDSVIVIPEGYEVFSDTSGIDFELVLATAWAEGHVFSAQDGYGIDHAWVHFHNDSISTSSGTGRDGYFIVPLLGGMYYEMEVGAEGFEHYHEDSVFVSVDEVQWMEIALEYAGWGEVWPPELYSVEDFPNDQGGRVRIRWTAGDPGPWGYFTGYSIWRHVPDSGWDPPLWDFIRMVPWHGYDDYSTVVPTLGNATPDDTTWTTFMVSAHTWDPNWFLDSNPLEGFSIDNLVPHTPENLQLAVSGGNFLLTWSPPVDEDFQYFVIYRDGEQLNTTIDSFFVDTEIDPTATYEYWITAFDFNGNESEPSASVTGSLSIDPEIIPTEFALSQNYPNPFNPATTIRFDVPTADYVTLSVYNLLGQEVKSLVAGNLRPGRYRFEWDGTDEKGNQVPSGIYIYRISADGGGFIETRKMTLLR